MLLQHISIPCLLNKNTVDIDVRCTNVVIHFSFLLMYLYYVYYVLYKCILYVSYIYVLNMYHVRMYVCIIYGSCMNVCIIYVSCNIIFIISKQRPKFCQVLNIFLLQCIKQKRRLCLIRVYFRVNREFISTGSQHCEL